MHEAGKDSKPRVCTVVHITHYQIHIVPKKTCLYISRKARCYLGQADIELAWWQYTIVDKGGGDYPPRVVVAPMYFSTSDVCDS